MLRLHMYIHSEKGNMPLVSAGLGMSRVMCVVLPVSQEDPWNAIISGAATGGILAARAGAKAAGKSALVGGVILAAIEGLNILVVSSRQLPQFRCITTAKKACTPRSFCRCA
jgi:hypothetical protein